MATKIHIKPENKGKFTAYKERTGKSTEEALHSSDAHVRQMANFARNAAKWNKKANGGEVNKYALGSEIGGLLGGAAGTAASFIPGLQPFAPLLMSGGAQLGSLVGGAFDDKTTNNTSPLTIPYKYTDFNQGKDIPLNSMAGGGEVPVEIEGGESVLTNGNIATEAVGPKHEDGGIKTTLPSGSFVFPSYAKSEVADANGNSLKLNTLKAKVIGVNMKLKANPRFKYALGDEVGDDYDSPMAKYLNYPNQQSSNISTATNPISNPNNPFGTVTNMGSNGNVGYTDTGASASAGANPLLKLGQYAPTIYNTIKGLSGYDKVNANTISTEPSNDVRNLKYNIQPMLDSNNRNYSGAKSYIRNNSNSQAVANANMGSAYSKKLTADNEANAVKTNTENQYRITGDQMLNSTNSFNSQVTTGAEDATARNKGATANFLGAAATGVGQISTDNLRDSSMNDMDQKTLDVIRRAFPSMRNANNAQLLQIFKRGVNYSG